jgi:putative hydrolase of HD superfamily
MTAGEPSGDASGLDPERIVDTVEALDPLSELPRTGWLLRGVRPCESIADHSHGVSLVAMMMADALREQGTPVDGERVLRMALVHDAPEAKTGDIPMPHKTAELDRALDAVEQELAERTLPGPLARAWDEMQAGETLEARIVKAADKIHMMIKAMLYERRGRGQLDEFWQHPGNFDARGIDLAQEIFEVIRARAGHSKR